MPIDETYEKVIGIFLADIEEAERMVPMNPTKKETLSPAMAVMTSYCLSQKSVGKTAFEKVKQKVTIEEIGNTL